MKNSDRVWDVITESAKSRFDFDSFEQSFEGMGETHIAENLLFMTLAGIAQDRSSEEIVKNIQRNFLLLGISVDTAEFVEFVDQRRKDSAAEIVATKTALALFEMGAETPGVLVQTRSILNRAL